MTSPDNQKAQVRLILPREWIFQLDAIAKSNFSSRLALLRRYIRAQLDNDLEKITAQLDADNQQRRTVERLRQLQTRLLGE